MSVLVVDATVALFAAALTSVGTRQVQEWPSEVQLGTFRLDLSHMVTKGDPTPRGSELGGAAAWQTPRDSEQDTAQAAEDERLMELLRSALVQSEPQRVSAPPQVCVAPPTRRGPTMASCGTLPAPSTLPRHASHCCAVCCR